MTRSPVFRPFFARRADGRQRLRRPGGAVLAAGVVSVAAVVAAAAPAAADPVVLAVAGSLDEVCTHLRNWLIGILATVATVYLTVGGARYLLSGGDAGEVERAKACVRAALIGYSLAILAPVVVEVLKSLVGG
ncbi:pilin [Nocardia terpenica]|uniref:pilin n=1 Tax=Nocardia terpenica TaxID=455432 RepID=UPI0018D4F2BD|nr:pilin [Nocardia terpenica]